VDAVSRSTRAIPGSSKFARASADANQAATVMRVEESSRRRTLPPSVRSSDAASCQVEHTLLFVSLYLLGYYPSSKGLSRVRARAHPLEVLHHQEDTPLE
jgi:hypothetical protein